MDDFGQRVLAEMQSRRQEHRKLLVKIFGRKMADRIMVQGGLRGLICDVLISKGEDQVAIEQIKEIMKSVPKRQRKNPAPKKCADG